MENQLKKRQLKDSLLCVCIVEVSVRRYVKMEILDESEWPTYEDDDSEEDDFQRGYDEADDYKEDEDDWEDDDKD